MDCKLFKGYDLDLSKQNAQRGQICFEATAFATAALLPTLRDSGDCGCHVLNATEGAMNSEEHLNERRADASTVLWWSPRISC